MLQKYNGYNVHSFNKGYTILQLQNNDKKIKTTCNVN